MEEVDMRIAETRKDTYEFKRDIIIGAENARTGKIIAEKMIRFMEEKLRQKDTVGRRGGPGLVGGWLQHLCVGDQGRAHAVPMLCSALRRATAGD